MKQVAPFSRLMGFNTLEYRGFDHVRPVGAYAGGVGTGATGVYTCPTTRKAILTSIATYNTSAISTVGTTVYVVPNGQSAAVQYIAYKNGALAVRGQQGAMGYIGNTGILLNPGDAVQALGTVSGQINVVLNVIEVPVSSPIVGFSGTLPTSGVVQNVYTCPVGMWTDQPHTYFDNGMMGHFYNQDITVTASVQGYVVVAGTNILLSKANLAPATAQPWINIAFFPYMLTSIAGSNQQIGLAVAGGVTSPTNYWGIAHEVW